MASKLNNYFVAKGPTLKYHLKKNSFPCFSSKKRDLFFDVSILDIFFLFHFIPFYSVQNLQSFSEPSPHSGLVVFIREDIYTLHTYSM